MTPWRRYLIGLVILGLGLILWTIGRFTDFQVAEVVGWLIGVCGLGIQLWAGLTRSR